VLVQEGHVRNSSRLATLAAAVLILAAIVWALGTERARSNAAVGSDDDLRFSTLIPSDRGALEACAVCHRIDADGPESSAPALWGIVGTARGDSPWFGYSKALAAATGPWTAADIDAYLADPVGYLPGTTKTLSQVRDADERKRIIEALQQLKP
jgi:cytochrome c